MGKRKWGDRKDAVKLRRLDSMHYIMPLLFPTRCESEVFIHQRIDLTNANEYIRTKNLENPEFRYSLFHIIIAAILKTVVLRPHLNRFISAPNIYQRNNLSAAFIVKTGMTDDAQESLAFIQAEENDNLDTIRRKIYAKVEECRDPKPKDGSERAMAVVARMPGVIRSLIGYIVRALDHKGLMPQSVIADDPHYASVFISQLGSIRLGAAYHHLTNWGTNSLFLTVGEKKMRPFYDIKGNVTMKNSIELGFTVDERISDGFYFAKSIRLMKKLLEHPELLEGAFSETVLY